MLSSEIFLEQEMFHIKVVEKIKTCVLSFFQKIVPFKNNVAKYGPVRQAADGNMIRRMRVACLITKATDIHTEYVIIIAFLRQQWLRERALLLRYT